MGWGVEQELFSWSATISSDGQVIEQGTDTNDRRHGENIRKDSPSWSHLSAIYVFFFFSVLSFLTYAAFLAF